VAIVRYTSTTNFVVRWVLMFCGLLCLGLLAKLFEVSLSRMVSGISPHSRELASWGFGFAGILLVAACVPGDGDNYLDGITCYVYANLILGASISWSDSKRLTDMFASNAYDRWYPMAEVKKLSKEIRRDAIMALASRVGRLGPVPTLRDLKKEARWKIPLLLSALPIYMVSLNILAGQVHGFVRIDQTVPWGLLPIVAIFLVMTIPWLTALKIVIR